MKLKAVLMSGLCIASSLGICFFNHELTVRAAGVTDTQSDVSQDASLLSNDASEYDTSGQTIRTGVYVDDVNLSGMSKDQARAALEDYMSVLNTKTLNLTYQGDCVSVPVEALNLSADIDTVIEHAMHVGERGNIIQRYKEAEDAGRLGIHLKFPVYCDENHVREMLEAHLDELNTDPVEVSMVRKGGQFIISESHDGRNVYLDETAGQITAAINEQWDKQDLSVEMTADIVPAKHTTEELTVVKDLLGGYSTSYYGSSANRITNIENGAQKIDNYILWPGESFSFLSMTVPFTEDNGYRMAGTYAAGRSVDGMGGGICQVSSTLYNAVLRAELTIVNRMNHMMTVGYVPISADATIANPDIDFVFRNDYEYPVFLEVYAYGGSVYANVYGVETRPAERTIEFVSVTEQTIEPGADVITYDWSKPSWYTEVTQNAHTGYVASLYKYVYMNGALTDQILVNRSTYNASPRYITKGGQEDSE